jgi:hypothetical protein
MQNSIKQPSAKVKSTYTGNYWGTSIVLRRTRSTTDQIFCIRQILEKKLEYNEEVHQLLKGFKKSLWFVWKEGLSYSDFFLPKQSMCRGTLLHLITLDDTHTVGLLWTTDQRDAETSTRQHTTLTRERQPCPRRDSYPKSQQTRGVDPRLRPHGHRDRLEGRSWIYSVTDFDIPMKLVRIKKMFKWNMQ